MDLFNRNDLKDLLAEHRPPCISLFMPAHPGGAQEDSIRWWKLLAEAEESLERAGWRAAEVKEVLEPGRGLIDDIEFWKYQSDGLAAFFAPQFQRVFRLPLSFLARVVAANRFSITPPCKNCLPGP